MVGTGSVGGDAVVLPAGSCRVEAATSLPKVFESVVVRERRIRQIAELETGT